jgi:predicted GNAT family N-acyltransferase
MNAKSPQSPAEWESYYDLRWRILRAPWNQPRGGDPDEGQGDMLHAMIGDDDGRAIAVGRIIFKSAEEAQIRSMATEEGRRGEGLGRRIMDFLEQAARNRGVKVIFLNAREQAAGFYARLGYEVVGPGPLLFGVIPHLAMRKQV